MVGRNVPDAPHVGRELVHFVKRTVDHVANEIRIPEVSDDEVVSPGLGMLMKFKIDPTYPELLLLQAFYQVSANETSGP